MPGMVGVKDTNTVCSVHYGEQILSLESGNARSYPSERNLKGNERNSIY